MEEDTQCMDVMMRNWMMLRISIDPIGNERLRKFHDMIYISDGHNHRADKRATAYPSSLEINSPLNERYYNKRGVSCIFFCNSLGILLKSRWCSIEHIFLRFIIFVTRNSVQRMNGTS